MKSFIIIGSILFALTSTTFAGGAYHQKLLEGMGESLVVAGGKKGAVASLTEKKFLFIYFSAHWCPPCRAFTPKLVNFYNTNSAKGDFDLLFISSDEDQSSMDNYMKQAVMPWSGVKLGNRKAAYLKSKYGVTGIPCLVLLDENDQVLASSYEGERYLGPEVALRKYLALQASH